MKVYNFVLILLVAFTFIFTNTGAAFSDAIIPELENMPPKKDLSGLTLEKQYDEIKKLMPWTSFLKPSDKAEYSEILKKFKAKMLKERKQLKKDVAESEKTVKLTASTRKSYELDQMKDRLETIKMDLYFVDEFLQMLKADNEDDLKKQSLENSIYIYTLAAACMAILSACCLLIVKRARKKS